MPCIQLTTNKKMNDEQKLSLKADFGKAIELIPRKSEKWLMCVFKPEVDMTFHGDRDDIALLEVDVFGPLEKEPAYKLTVALTEIVSKSLSIEADCIYVKYGTAQYWGWNGKNF